MVFYVSIVAGLLASIAVAGGGCATIINGKTQEIQVSTNPTGATVSIDTMQTVITPATVNLRRNKDYIFTITKQGYQTQIIPVTGVLSGWVLGNLVFGGLIGGAVDAATGSGFTLTPEKINIALSPIAAGQIAASAPTEPLTLDDRDRLADEMLAKKIVDKKQHKAIKAKIAQERSQAATQKPPQ